MTTIKSAKLMIATRQPEALWAIEAASDGHPVLLMAGAAVVSRRVRGWGAPAIAVDPSTASRLASHTVTVHVPLMHEAAVQCGSLSELASPEPVHGAGWLCRARPRGTIVDAALAAALHGERDPIEDPIVALALGRPPAAIDEDDLARHAEQVRERREASWARREPPPCDPTDEARARNPALDRRIDELELSVSTYGVLDRAGLQTIADLCGRTEPELLKLRGFGRKHLAELKQILADLGLSLGMRDA